MFKYDVYTQVGLQCLHISTFNEEMAACEHIAAILELYICLLYKYKNESQKEVTICLVLVTRL